MTEESLLYQLTKKGPNQPLGEQSSSADYKKMRKGVEFSRL